MKTFRELEEKTSALIYSGLVPQGEGGLNIRFALALSGGYCQNTGHSKSSKKGVLMRGVDVALKMFAVLVVAGGLLSACEGVKSEARYPDRRSGDGDLIYHGERDTIFGKGKSIGLFSKDKNKDAVAGITVNPFLWRAALDTVSFMPLASADPFGGTILTDWYEAPETPGERLKANIFVLGQELRTDALKITLFRQTMQNGAWRDATVDPATVTALENTVLTRARELRVATKE
jgi:hypothetical protein